MRGTSQATWTASGTSAAWPASTCSATATGSTAHPLRGIRYPPLSLRLLRAPQTLRVRPYALLCLQSPGHRLMNGARSSRPWTEPSFRPKTLASALDFRRRQALQDAHSVSPGFDWMLPPLPLSCLKSYRASTSVLKTGIPARVNNVGYGIAPSPNLRDSILNRRRACRTSTLEVKSATRR